MFVGMWVLIMLLKSRAHEGRWIEPDPDDPELHLHHMASGGEPPKTYPDVDLVALHHKEAHHGHIEGPHEKHLLFTSHHKRYHSEHHAYNPEHFLLLGSENGNIAQVRYALERGADINARNNNGVSALIWAANNGHVGVVQLLLQHGANINEFSNNYRTSLMWACYWGHDKVVEFLLEKGALYKIYDDDGMTPLMAAAFSGNRYLVDVLLEKPGIAITETNLWNGTALSIAKAHGHKEVVEVLESYFPPDLHSDNILVLMANVLLADFRILYYKILRELRFHAGLSVAEEL